MFLRKLLVPIRDLDILLWHVSQWTVYLIELIVPWEETYERKKLRYADLGAVVKQQGWKLGFVQWK